MKLFLSQAEKCDYYNTVYAKKELRESLISRLYISRSTEAIFVSHQTLNGGLFSFLARTQDMDKFSSFAEDVTLARF